MKTPKFLSKLSAVLTPRPRKKLQATARAVPRAAMDDYDAEEPTTKLSSAFVVVLILHVVAVGGIYAFNSIKASRRDHEQPPAPTVQSAKSSATTREKAPAPASATPVAAAPRLTNQAAAFAPVPAVASPRAAAPKTYQVKTNDTLTKIAGASGIKMDELLAANGLKEGAVLQIGQPLIIPAPKVVAKPAAVEAARIETPIRQVDVQPTRTTPGKHIVKKGDTATSIAKIYRLTADELLKLNKITDAKKLQPGQTLTIPKKKG